MEGLERVKQDDVVVFQILERIMDEIVAELSEIEEMLLEGKKEEAFGKLKEMVNSAWKLEETSFYDDGWKLKCFRIYFKRELKDLREKLIVSIGTLGDLVVSFKGAGKGVNAVLDGSSEFFHALREVCEEVGE